MSYPALIANPVGTSTTDTNTNDMGRRVEELLGVSDQFLVTNMLSERVDGHGGHKLLVANSGAVGHSNSLALGVDLLDLALLTEAGVFLGNGVGDSNPDTTSTVAGGETESSVRTPVTSGLVEDDVGGHSLDVGSGDTLTEPSALHLSTVVTDNAGFGDF